MKGDSGTAHVICVPAIALLMVGCAPLTEKSIEAREDSRIEFQNRFILDRTLCFERGGRIEVHADAVELNRDGVPERRVQYFCVLRQS